MKVSKRVLCIHGSKPKISSDADLSHHQDSGTEHAHVIDKVIKACCMNHKVITPCEASAQISTNETCMVGHDCNPGPVKEGSTTGFASNY